MGKKKTVGKVTLKDVNKLKAMIKKVKLLNFYNDKEITDSLNQLEDEIDKFKGDRDEDLIVDKLKKIVDMGDKEFRPSNFNPSISYLEIED